MLQVTLPYTIRVVYCSAFVLAWDQKFSLPATTSTYTAATADGTSIYLMVLLRECVMCPSTFTLLF